MEAIKRPYDPPTVTSVGTVVKATLSKGTPPGEPPFGMFLSIGSVGFNL